MHATHVYNRTPMHCLKWDTPYTLLNGEAPDVSHLKVFGCGAYVHISKGNAHKWASIQKQAYGLSRLY